MAGAFSPSYGCLHQEYLKVGLLVQKFVKVLTRFGVNSHILLILMPINKMVIFQCRPMCQMTKLIDSRFLNKDTLEIKKWKTFRMVACFNVIWSTIIFFNNSVLYMFEYVFIVSGNLYEHRLTYRWIAGVQGEVGLLRLSLVDAVVVVRALPSLNGLVSKVHQIASNLTRRTNGPLEINLGIVKDQEAH